MDENKIVELNTNKKEEVKNEKEEKFRFSLQTNPILQKMLLANANSKKDKFKFKDLFR
ncbi:MAG: hypothetical protein IJY61_03775 [Candidatus Gastranaerophilales bacterium]|nr:hypothetical protein [Candidatus Gastranaerophilales bacterium]